MGYIELVFFVVILVGFHVGDWLVIRWVKKRRKNNEHEGVYGSGCDVGSYRDKEGDDPF